MTKPALEPYPGLRPYREDEQDKFFGRDADKYVLVDKILNNRLTLLFAASGVGKSSLLQASIIPYLKAEQGENLSVVYYIDWVSEPIHHLRQAIWLALQTEGLLAADSEIQGSTLGEALEFCSLFVRHPLVLILDQFEEFFRYQAPQQRQAFISQLTSVITNTLLPVSLVISMREDFALELNAFKPRLPTILFENFYRLEKLGREATEQAIVQPVARLGFEYEPALLKALLNDLLSRELDRNPHAPVAELRMNAEPPYLQIVCAHLWRLNQADPEKKLRLNTYAQAGRAKGILENYIKGILQPLSRPEKDLASQAFDHLVGQRGVKKAYTASALASTLQAKEADVQKLLEALEQARILRKQQRGEETWYELYHDMFSSSLEAWNLAWKEQMRRRRLFKGAFLGLSALAAVVLSWDFYINYTSYHLRLSPQAEISDRVELWQGKLNSWDLFRQQRYLAETDFEREQLEPDKKFAKRALVDTESLQQELIGFQPNEQRIESYTRAGEHNKALETATDMLLHKNPVLAERASQPLFTIRVIDTSKKVKEILAKAESDSVKKSISIEHDTSNMPISFTRLLLDQGFDKSNEYQKKIFTYAIINRQLPTELTIPALMDALKDNDSAVRSSAATALGWLKADSTIPDLITLLKDNEIEVRRSAADTLGLLKADSAIPDLIALLKDNELEVRSSAADTLGLLKADSAIPDLIALLKDNELRVNWSAAKALGRLKADSALPDLTSLLKDNDSEVRYRAATALGLLKVDSAIPDLIALLKDNDIYVRSNAADALGLLKADSAIPALIALLKHNDSEVRSSAVTALGLLKADSAIPDLIALLKDNDTYVRSNAATALGRLKADRAIPDLIALLKDNDSGVRYRAAETLGRLKADRAIPDLIALLKDNDSGVRYRAAETLGRLKADSAIPDLIALLKDNELRVNWSAAKALGRLKADSALPDLTPLLKDEDSSIRSNAAEVLGQLKANSAIPDLIPLLKDNASEVRSSAAEALGKILAKEAITLNLTALDGNYFYAINSIIGFIIPIPHLGLTHLKVDFYPDLDGYFEHISDISGAELIDFTLRKLSSIDEEESAKALRAALKLKNNGYLNSTQIKIIDKALSQIDPELIQAAEQTIAEAQQQQAEEEKNRRSVNQPYPETQPLSLDELKAKLNQLDQDYAEWRKQRDTETDSNSTTETLEDPEAKKLKNLEREVYLYNYAFAIARMDQESGIELLKHNLFKVRQAAASGLVNSDQFKPELLEGLEQEWLATQDPIIRQSLYHAIDTSLLVLEGIGGQAELDFLKAYQPTLTDPASLASIQPRVEWTIFQLQWRMDQVKDLEQLGKDQEPELLERYCLNADGSDKKPEECTMRPY